MSILKPVLSLLRYRSTTVPLRRDLKDYKSKVLGEHSEDFEGLGDQRQFGGQIFVLGDYELDAPPRGYLASDSPRVKLGAVPRSPSGDSGDPFRISLVL